MYILYLDESGDPSSWQTQRNFVLAGVAVHEGQVEHLSARLEQIQRQFLPGLQFQVKLHAGEIHSGHGRFRDIVPAEREKLLLSVYNTMATATFPRLLVFAAVVNESCAVDADQVLRDSFQDVCSRFNIFMRRQYERDRPTKGLLVIDQAHEERYERLFHQFKGYGTDFGYINNIIDRPYFARANQTRMLQLADFCAYAVFQRYEHDDPTYFKIIQPKIDRRAPNSSPDGLKHMTKVACQCEACSWRGIPLPFPGTGTTPPSDQTGPV